MKNIFGIALFLILSVASAQAQYKTFPKGKLGGDIIGKGDVRVEVVSTSSSASFYPITADGSYIEKAPASIEINVLYLGHQASEIYTPELQDGHYTVALDADKIIYYYFVKGTFDNKLVEFKEQMVEYGK
jgi:hypothetical protein